MADLAPGYSLVREALAEQFDAYRKSFKDYEFPDVGDLVAPVEVCALLSEWLEFVLFEYLKQGRKRVHVICASDNGEFLTLSVKTDIPEIEISRPLKLRELERRTIYLNGFFGLNNEGSGPPFFVVTIPITL